MYIHLHHNFYGLKKLELIIAWVLNKIIIFLAYKNSTNPILRACIVSSECVTGEYNEYLESDECVIGCSADIVSSRLMRNITKLYLSERISAQ